MARKIFVIAGEHSGDVLGAGLMEALKAQAGDGGVEFSGIGGPLMEAQGLESLLPMDELCVMGLFEVVFQLKRLMKLIDAVVDEIEKFQPDIVVTIDLPDFNFQVGSRLKKRGSKARLVHYVAPTVWAWRAGRAKKVAGFLDGLICLYPFEPPYFTKHGLPAEFVGHPLIQNDLAEADGPGFREQVDIAQDATVVGLFLGSRLEEIRAHSKVLLETARLLYEQYPDLQVLVPTLQNLEYEVKQIIADAGFPAVVLLNPDDKWDEFAACDAALGVSGTVGLELAYLGVPHIIAYRMHPVSWFLVKLLVKTKYAHLANILLDEAVVPEYLQGKCRPELLTRAMLKLLKEEEARNLQLGKTEKIRELLTAAPGKSPSAMAAEYVLKIAAQPPRVAAPKPAKSPKKEKAPAPKKPVPAQKKVPQKAPPGKAQAVKK